MISGRKAFPGTNHEEILQAIVHSPVPRLRAICPGIPYTLDGIVSRCLNKSPERRPQTADLFDVLKKLETGHRIKGPLAAVALTLLFAVIGIVIWALTRRPTAVEGWRDWMVNRSQPHQVHSLAVLPLVNLSHDPDQDYFVDGMTDELITVLAQASSLRVISRTSVMRYRGAKTPLPEIARALAVDAVLEGSVVRSDGRVRITAQLIDARSDRHLWARSYERNQGDVLAIQDEVAQDIGREIAAKFRPEARVGGDQNSSVSPQAYDDYLRARYFWNKRSADALKQSVEYYRRAIQADPGYARAYAGLAQTYAVMATPGLLGPQEAFSRAQEAARKALALDGTLAEAHATLGLMQEDYGWDWQAAEKEFGQAIAVDPGYATAHQWYSNHLSLMGRHREALTEAKRALALDPLALPVNAQVGVAFYYAHRYEEAIEQFQKTLNLEPGFALARERLAAAYEQKGLYREAISELEKGESAAAERTTSMAWLGIAYARVGRTREAEKILLKMRALSPKLWVSPCDLAAIYIGLGENSKALGYLKEAYVERDSGLNSLQVDPIFDPLRSDPRFQDLIRGMAFPPQ